MTTSEPARLNDGQLALLSLIAELRRLRRTTNVGSEVVAHVVRYLRAHAATFDDGVAEEARTGGTRYAYVKRDTALTLADRIERAGQVHP